MNKPRNILIENHSHLTFDTFDNILHRPPNIQNKSMSNVSNVSIVKALFRQTSKYERPIWDKNRRKSK